MPTIRDMKDVCAGLFVIALAVGLVVGCGGENVIENLQEGYLHIVDGNSSSPGTVAAFTVDPETGDLTLVDADPTTGGNLFAPDGTNPFIIGNVESTGDGNIFLLGGFDNRLQALAVDLADGSVTSVSGPTAVTTVQPRSMYRDGNVLVLVDGSSGSQGSGFTVFVWNPVGQTFSEAAGMPYALSNVYHGSGLFQDGRLFLVTGSSGNPFVVHHFSVSSTGAVTLLDSATMGTFGTSGVALEPCFDGTHYVLAVYDLNSTSTPFAPVVFHVGVRSSGGLTYYGALTLSSTVQAFSSSPVVTVGGRFCVGESIPAGSLIHPLVVATGSAPSDPAPYLLTGVQQVRLEASFGDILYFEQVTGGAGVVSALRSMRFDGTTFADTGLVVHTGWNTFPNRVVRQGKVFAATRGINQAVDVIRADPVTGDLTRVGVETVPLGTNTYIPMFTLVP